jgi:tetratricopeptide (TPR) repeat protein
MNANELHTWLTDGIAAAQAGRRAEARELLLRVVGIDESNGEAWLWLSRVVTTLEDREVCFENVLALDPTNEAAQRGLAEVRAQIAATPELEPESVLLHIEVERLLEKKVAFDFSDTDLDDPLLCVYCAHKTSEDDQQCPNCKRNLYSTFYEHEKPRWIWTAWMMSIAEAIFVVGGLLILAAILASALGVVKFNGQTVDVVDVFMVYFGQKTMVPPQAQAAILAILPREQFYLRLGFVLLDLVVAFGLLTRKRIFYVLYIATLAIAAALLFTSVTLNSRTFVTSGAAATPLEGILQVALNEALGVLVKFSIGIFGLFLLIKTALAFAMNDDFDTVTERLWCVIDRTVRDPNGAFIRAKAYMKRDMWTLAALYLQRALSIQPSTVDYYLGLAECYARLGRYQSSLHLLDQAQQLQPESPVIPNLRGVILELQARAASTSTGGV